METRDSAWSDSPALENLKNLSMPRLRLFRRISPVLASAVFLLTALLLPQRIISGSRNTILANDIVADLKTTVEELKKNDLLTDRKSTRLNSSHSQISYAVFCLK